MRQQVLEAHGWIIHRVWSADWYLRPQAELKKIEHAIASAAAEWSARDEEGYKPARAVPLMFEAERVGDTEIVTAVMEPGAALSSGFGSYVEADFPVNRHLEPHEVPIAEMASHVAKIVEIEGPIHLDEITARIRILWGLSRAGARIRAMVERAVGIVAQNGLIEGGPFYSVPGHTSLVRDRAKVTSASLRKPEMLPPAEIEQAILNIVDANFGADRGDLILATSRAFGFAATSSQLRGVLEEGVVRLEADGRLVARNGLLVRPKSVG